MNFFVRFTFIILILVCARITGLNAQESNLLNYSNADELILREKVAKDPQLRQLYIDFEKQLRLRIAAMKQLKTDTLIDSMRIIPVVFHIIHKGGVENISNDQVRDAVALINIDYNKQNADTASTYAIFKARAANLRIQFRLAKIDPHGNCTDGIEHIYDPETNFAYFPVMSRYSWSPSKYMNIFSVAFIYPSGMSLPDGAFIGGMSPFPPSNPLTQAMTGGDTLADGVLIRHDCIGSIGTATNMGGMPINSINRSFTHETGHYFNLYHTFNSILGMGCYDISGISGDEVSDTPPVTAATQNTSASCFTPGSRNTCTNDVPDEPDMIENYMDYQWGFCTNIFTQGQMDRVNATLTADRRKLWSVENLIATGVLDTTNNICAPKADFNSNTRMICAGSTVNFMDMSYRGPVDSLIWTFEGGNPATSNNRYPTVTYSNAGLYYVTLKVINSAGQDSIIKQAFVRVLDPSVTTDAPFIEGFESGIVTNWFLNNDAGNSWEASDSSAYNGSKSMAIRNFAGNSAGSYDEIITGPFNLTTLPAGSMAMMKFKLAYAGKYIPGTFLIAADTAYDVLRIYGSTDCGSTWQRLYNKTGTALATTAPVQTSFIPSAQTMWRGESVGINLFRTQTNVRFKFEFFSNGGNNLFVDDINICLATYGMEDNQGSELNIKLFPNPVTTNTDLTFTLLESSDISVKIYDLLGREIAVVFNGEMESGNHSIDIDRSIFGQAGVYIVRLDVNGKMINHKIIAE